MIRAVGIILMLQAAVTTLPEHLVAPTLTGFITGYSAQNSLQSIEERVPRGDTVEQWSRMITVQRFGGIARIGSHGFLDRLADGAKRGCAGAIVTPIEDVVVDGRTVSTVRVDCPLNVSTGKPETFFAKVFTGSTDLHSVQFAFRSVPNPADIVFARTYLDTVVLCPGTAKACSAH